MALNGLRQTVLGMGMALGYRLKAKFVPDAYPHITLSARECGAWVGRVGLVQGEQPCAEKALSENILNSNEVVKHFVNILLKQLMLFWIPLEDFEGFC